MQGDVRALGGGGLHADHLAVFDDKLVGAGIGHNLNAVGRGRVGENGNDVAVSQTVGARPHRAQNGGGGVVPHRADAFGPLQRVQRVGGEGAGQLQIRFDDGAVQTGALAAHVGVEHVQLRRIEQGGGTAGDILVNLALDGLQHLGERAEVGRVEVEVALQLAEQRFAHLGVGLTLGVASVEALARNQRVAAEGTGLLHEDDLRAVLGRGDGRGQTRAAAAEHDDVIRRFHIFNGRLLHRDGLERFHVAARLRHAVRNGGQDGVGGVGRAGHSIHREGLVFHDGGRDLRDRTIGQAGGLAVLNDGHVGDRVRAERHRDGHRAVVALRSSGVSALGVSQRHRAGHHHHEEHQKGCCELFHGYFSFFLPLPEIGRRMALYSIKKL